MSAGCSSTQGTHQEAKKFSSSGLPDASSALEKPWPGAWDGSVKSGTGWPMIGLGTPRGSNVPDAMPRSMAQNDTPPTAATAIGAMSRSRRAVQRVHQAGTATARRAGAPTRKRRSTSERPPPIAITRPPSQIQGASGL